MAGLIQAAEQKSPEDLTEEDKMALLGRPKTGETTRALLRIIESKEFKVSAPKTVMYLLYFRYDKSFLALLATISILSIRCVSPNLE